MNTPIDIGETVSFARKAKEEFGLSVVHLTGGEPTLHPRIVYLVDAIKKAELNIQMTTNGDSNPDLMNNIISAGVGSINFSLHAITVEDFRKTQSFGGLSENHDYYVFLMKRKISNIEMAKKLVHIKLNTVVINDQITGRVIDFALERGIPLRLMRNFNDVEKSDRIINKLFFEKGLCAVKEQEAIGDSGGSGTVFEFADRRSQKPDVKVKKFGDVYLDSICNGCPLKHTPRCKEKFYGLRMGVNSETLKNEVMLCISRNDKEVIIDPQEVFQGKHLEALKHNYGR